MHCVAEESLRCNFVRHNGEILAISQKQLHGTQRYSSFSNDRVMFVLRINDLEARLNYDVRVLGFTIN